MLSFPNCKINLGLRILDKRPDGFHNLQTVFYPVPLCDALEIIRNPDNQPEIVFTTTGIPVTTTDEENLCIKAWKRIKNIYPDMGPVRVHLHKAIPSGAGLGGGSSDAAFTLILLNNLFRLGLSENELMAHSLNLGSDCPFFIRNKACSGSGRGEVLSPVDIRLNGMYLVLINPGIHIPTGKAFAGLATLRSGRIIDPLPLEQLSGLPVREWKQLLVNDFEEVVFPEYPEIGAIKDELYNRGALYASLSGSGSTVFGLFEDETDAGSGWPQAWFVRTMLL